MPKFSKARLQKIADELKPKKPVVSIRQIEKEAGLPNKTINQLLSGKLKWTEERIEKLLPVLRKYGLIK